MPSPDPKPRRRRESIARAAVLGRHAARALACVAIVTSAATCQLNGDEHMLGEKDLYYPTGLVVSAGGSTLYVANSDFDLQFSGGSVHAVDAAALRAAVAPIALGLASGDGASAACSAAGLGLNLDPFLNPGPCAPIAYAPLVRASVYVGAFASGLMLAYDPRAAGARLFAPVRGDPSVTFFDVADDRAGGSEPFALDCGRTGSGFCGDAHRIGRDADRSQRGLQLPPDPVGIASSTNGEAVVSAHPSQAAASLVVNPWEETPFLSYFAGDLAPGPTEIASVPRPAFVAAAEAQATLAGLSFIYRDAFVVTYRGAAQLDVLQYVRDSGSVPSRPFIARAQQVPITTSSSNTDHRGVAVLSSERAACEASCGSAAGDVECLAACAETIPLRVFVASRSPESLLLGRIETVVLRGTSVVDGVTTARITGAFDLVTLDDALPLDFGASRVETGRVIAEDGTAVDRVFAVAFDSRRVFIVDPYRARIEGVVRTGRGPHDIAIDQGVANGEAYSYLYVGHFTDSYLGVVPLDLRRALTYGSMIATVGTPLPPIDTL